MISVAPFVVPGGERVVSNEAASLPKLGGWLCKKRAKAEFECYLYVIFFTFIVANA
jgi:hypothetical protein